MLRYSILLWSALGTGAVSAQPGPRTEPGEPPADARQQRRVELREVLAPGRQPGYASGTNTATLTNAPAPSRHLTPQERFELREQLRREQNENRRNRQ